MADTNQNSGSSRSYSLSFDGPIDVEIPKAQCSGNSPEELKEWVWKHHQDKIMNALRLEPDSEASLSEDPKREEDKNKDPSLLFNNKKRRLALMNGKSRQNLLDTIAHVQRQFFQSASPKVVFGYLLEGLLELMSSEYGFIGEIKYEEDGTMYLQCNAITNIAWNQATLQFYEDNIHNGT
jgi:hypothetical protein